MQFYDNLDAFFAAKKVKGFSTADSNPIEAIVERAFVAGFKSTELRTAHNCPGVIATAVSPDYDIDDEFNENSKISARIKLDDIFEPMWRESTMFCKIDEEEIAELDAWADYLEKTAAKMRALADAAKKRPARKCVQGKEDILARKEAESLLAILDRTVVKLKRLNGHPSLDALKAVFADLPSYDHEKVVNHIEALGDDMVGLGDDLGGGSLYAWSKLPEDTLRPIISFAADRLKANGGGYQDGNVFVLMYERGSMASPTE
jgi:hypothetical protein